MRNTITVAAALAAPLTFAAVALAGCSDGSTPADEPSPAAAAVEYEGVAPDALVACLDDAGAPAAVGDSVPFGVEVPTVAVEAAGGATLWVFRTVADAEDNRTTITLSETDTPLGRLAGNVVVSYDDPGTAPVEAVDACLA
ncbi:hypothetical protein GCM10023340_02420 [Nocardioides marinquilinus]|uniref:Lipoprotein n=1 Tax=Nocardioides marinquilinus TaxID=1210400 RepID=A0ABP9P5L3_9ACTN